MVVRADDSFSHVLPEACCERSSMANLTFFAASASSEAAQRYKSLCSREASRRLTRSNKEFSTSIADI